MKLRYALGQAALERIRLDVPPGFAGAVLVTRRMDLVRLHHWQHDLTCVKGTVRVSMHLLPWNFQAIGVLNADPKTLG